MDWVLYYFLFSWWWSLWALRSQWRSSWWVCELAKELSQLLQSSCSWVYRKVPEAPYLEEGQNWAYQGQKSSQNNPELEHNCHHQKLAEIRAAGFWKEEGSSAQLHNGRRGLLTGQPLCQSSRYVNSSVSLRTYFKAEDLKSQAIILKQNGLKACDRSRLSSPPVWEHTSPSTTAAQGSHIPDCQPPMPHSLAATHSPPVESRQEKGLAFCIQVSISESVDRITIATQLLEWFQTHPSSNAASRLFLGFLPYCLHMLSYQLKCVLPESENRMIHFHSPWQLARGSKNNFLVEFYFSIFLEGYPKTG